MIEEEAGSSLLNNTVSSTKSYGATNSRMLTVIDSKVITHKIKPTDTLQGLAIKYGVTVEKLKRLNKLWTNNAILTKDTLLIPSEDGKKITSDNESEEPGNLKTVYVKPETEEDINERKKKLKKVRNEISCEAGSDGEPGSSSKENKCDNSNSENLESKRLFNEIIGKADKTISQHKEEINEDTWSEGYKEFNNILSKIDGQIKTHKNKNMGGAVPNAPVPAVAYDSSYQNANPGLFSPTRQHPYLEQGI